MFALPERYDVRIRFHGVIPMAMRGQAVPRAKRVNTLRDVDREARRLGLPFGRIFDPIGEGATRCLAVSEHAIDVGRERAFVLAAGRAIWAEGVEVATDAGLRPVCEEAGLDWAACAAAIEDPALAARVDANTQALLDLHHWGVPVTVFGTDRFWGQDRIEDLERALEDAGLRR